MRYETARELVETILDQLDEGTARVARMAKSKNPNKKAFQSASNKVTRSELKREVNPNAVQGRADNRIKHPGPSQRAGFGSYGFNEATSVKRKLSSYKNQSEYMKGKRSAARYPEGHQKKGVSMKTDAVKQLRGLIDHHGGQVGVHSQLYNGSMNPEHRAQAYAHNDAKAAAIKAHKALTGKEYFGKKQTNVSPSMMKTDAKHHVRQTSHDGFRW